MRLDYFSQILGRRQPILLDRCALVKVAALLIAAISVVAPRSASAQATWEYTPYQVNVCIALDDEAEFTYAFAAHVREVLAARADMAFFASWKLAASSADSAVAGLMQTHWDKLNYDDIK